MLRSLTLLLIALAASPTAAQIAGPIPRQPISVPDPFLSRSSRIPAPSVWRDLGDIRDKIDQRRDSGGLSRREAKRLKRQARGIGRLAEQYARDGLSDSERRELENHALYLRSMANRADTSSQSRGKR
jgi:hypothetical protein